MARLRLAGARPAGPPPAGPAPGALAATSSVEVQRLVNSAGIITVGNKVVQVGSPLAGQRPGSASTASSCTSSPRTARSGAPCPARSRPASGTASRECLADPDPLPSAEQAVQRRVSSRGGIQVARQRIQVGMAHAGKTVTVICEHNTFRLEIDGETVGVLPRTTSTEIDRYKAHATRTGKQ